MSSGDEPSQVPSWVRKAAQETWEELIVRQAKYIAQLEAELAETKERMWDGIKRDADLLHRLRTRAEKAEAEVEQFQAYRRLDSLHADGCTGRHWCEVKDVSGGFWMIEGGGRESKERDDG